jgi:hypothetical protein
MQAETWATLPAWQSGLEFSVRFSEDEDANHDRAPPSEHGMIMVRTGVKKQFMGMCSVRSCTRSYREFAQFAQESCGWGDRIMGRNEYVGGPFARRGN